MESIIDIINNNDGIYDEIDKMSEERLAICKACPLYKETQNGPICNSNLYINIENKKDISDRSRVGYRRGCSCNLNKKTRLTIAKCIVEKW